MENAASSPYMLRQPWMSTTAEAPKAWEAVSMLRNKAAESALEELMHRKGSVPVEASDFTCTRNSNSYPSSKCRLHISKSIPDSSSHATSAIEVAMVRS